MPEPSLATTVASIPLSTCIYNASGPRTGTSTALSKIASSSSGAVLAKSATLVSQKGNPLPRTWHEGDDEKDSLASLNSEGLPNSGIDYYIDETTIVESVGIESNAKPYMVSISGCTLQDNLQMLQKIQQAKEQKCAIAGVELNLACPNVIGKPIIAYDFEQMDQVLHAVSQLPMFSTSTTGKNRMPLGVKMPPYFDGPHFEKASSVLNKYKHVVNYVACINTIGNAFSICPTAEMPVISSKGGFAGLSGKAVKYTALANVKKMRELLDEEIDVVGVGGVSTGTDAFEMILCGAAAVQVGTCHWTEGPKCFDRICKELQDIMKEKGYTSISDFKGKLKAWSKEGAALSRAAKKKKNAALGTSSSSGTSINVFDFYQILSAALLGLVAILLADKYGPVHF